MKKIVFTALLFLLSACTSTADIRQQCAASAQNFEQEVGCFEQMAAQDSYLSGDSFVQEYVLAGRTLVERLHKGEITETQARLELTREYNNLMLRQQQYQVYNSIQMDQLRPRHTTCHQSGNQTICDTY